VRLADASDRTGQSDDLHADSGPRLPRGNAARARSGPYCSGLEHYDRVTRMADIVKHGLTSGLGHTLTLFSFAGAAILLGWAIPDIALVR
jgi:hypothetical protein